MILSDFDYYLPKELIAQEPIAPRDSSRLLVIDRKTQTIQHRTFKDIGEFLREGDLLVINNAKVFPARLLGRKENTGGKIDLLLIEKRKEGLWKCLINASGAVKEGLEIIFGNNKLRGIVESKDKEIYLVRFAPNQSATEAMADGTGFNFSKILEEIGEMPLPPYIKNASEASKKKYQTVYAKKTGAIAAPTAGFHFTEKLINNLKEKGVSFAAVTLMVGRGTFSPIKTENVREHIMAEEYFEIDEAEKEKINKQLKNKGRIISVGTTTVRTLESIVPQSKSRQADKKGKITRNQGKTSLFIYPGYNFNAVDALITNFHLPMSTPLLLACAFVADLPDVQDFGRRGAPKLWRRSAGKELIFKAYQEAIEKKYRFYSFGDAMLIL